MKNIFWLPILVREYLKSFYSRQPSSEQTRNIEEQCRNERRLAAYRTKRLLS